MNNENSDKVRLDTKPRANADVFGLKSKRKINVIINGFDEKILDETTARMTDTLRKLGLAFSGPIPMPMLRKRFIVLKSPHVNKDARQTFELKDMKRLIQIDESKSAIAALKGMTDIHPSINIEIKFKGDTPKKVAHK